RQSAATLAELGHALSQAGRLDGGIRVLSLAQRLYPADFWIHFTLAHALGKAEPPSLERAAGCWRTALALRPGSATAWNGLAATLQKQHKLDEAMACLNMALRINSEFANGHFSRGVIFFQQNKVDEAIVCYHKAIELDPRMASAHGNLGI